MTHPFSELESIAKDIGEDLDDPPLVGNDWGKLLSTQGLLEHDRPLGHGRQGPHDMVHDLIDPHHILLEVEASPCSPHRDDVVDDAKKVGGAAGDCFHPDAMLLDRPRRPYAPDHGRAELDDCIEGSSELMADHRDELVLVAQGYLEVGDHHDALLVLLLQLGRNASLLEGDKVVVEDAR